MDGRTFDRLTRAAITRRAAGRGVIAGAIAVVLGIRRGDPVAAKPYSVPLGDACYRTIQCSPSASMRVEDEISCADNLIDWDGEFNCCRWRGGQCWDDTHCCGQNECIRGYCYPPF
jgi:hypothetical protein